ncbi:MAG: FAD-dependent oxidoreductase, partial [Pseudomonadota bacterium]
MLVGGGHAHVQVLRRLGMDPLPGVRVTVIAREPHTPYSGMLPGHVAGDYDYDDMHIDLGPLCRFAGARLLCAEVTGVDLESRTLFCAQRPAQRFDLLSLNIGASPRALPGATDAGTTGPGQLALPGTSAPPSERPEPAERRALSRVKPIGQFLPRWRATLEALREDDRILLLGAGAGAVELAFAMRRAVPATVGIALVGRTLLPGFSERARTTIRLQLNRARIALLEGDAVEHLDDAGARTSSGEQLQAEHYFDVTGVRAPAWLAGSGLLLDEQGFVRVDEHLRTLSHSFVFAAGDVAHLEGQPRPKSGVYAVRAGPVLYENLRRSFTDLPLKRFRAQRQALAILSTTPGQALAVRGPFAWHGAGPWRLKQRIDRRFMRRFQELPTMPEPVPPPQLKAALRAELPDPMRCGGCGGKLPADALGRALATLPAQHHETLVAGIGDDAARLQLASPGPEVLATVDGFSAFIDDPYRFGRIAAHHALGDVLAMGGRPTIALALATLPPMAPALLEGDL